jgi:hypothetical protein
VFNHISVAHDTNKMLNSFFWIKRVYITMIKEISTCKILSIYLMVTKEIMKEMWKAIT